MSTKCLIQAMFRLAPAVFCVTILRTMWGKRAEGSLLVGGLLALGISGAACSAASATKAPKKDASAFEEEFSGGEFEEEFNRFPKESTPPAFVVQDAAALAPPPAREASGGIPDGGRGTEPLDASAAKACGALAAGDLAIVEMMISSVSGSGDKGEWIEVQNTRDCTLTVSGLVFESPRGTSIDRLEIADTIVLTPKETFVIGGPSATVTGKVFRWTASDVLKNAGDTVKLSTSKVVLDEITYPGYSFTTGVSLSFPAGCKWADRSSWERWSASFHEWQTGFKGTPNADNVDVACY